MEAALSLIGSRRWTRRQRKAAQLQFDDFAHSQEPAYNAQAVLQFRLERNEAVNLARLTLEERPKGLSLHRGPTRARDAALGRQTKDPITEDSLRLFEQRLGRAYTQYHQDWRNRFLGLNNETSALVGARIAGETGVAFNVIDPHLRIFSMQATNRLAGNVPDATYRAILHNLNLGFENGEGVDRLARRVSDVFDKGLTYKTKTGVTRVISAKNRARLIARTETTYVSNGASLNGMIGGGQDDLYLKSWISQGDDRVRATHLDEESDSSDGIPLKESFPVTGLEHPGEPNCRCTLFYLPKKQGKPKPKPGTAKPGVPGPDTRAMTKARAKEIHGKLNNAAGKLEAAKMRVGDQMTEAMRTLTAIPDADRKFANLAYRKVTRRLTQLNARRRGLNGRYQRAQWKILERHPSRRGKFADIPGYKLQGYGNYNIDPMTGVVSRSKLPKRWRDGLSWYEKHVDKKALSYPSYGGGGRPPIRFNMEQVQGVRVAKYSNGTVYVRTQQDVATVVHEIGHALDDVHGTWKTQTRKFLKRRSRLADGGYPPAKRLPGYPADERGWPDAFYDVYVGKHYYSGSEITSMGMQAMVEDAWAFAEADFEHFHLMLRFMNGEMT